MKAIDLFCGCGGVTQGLKDTFKVISAIDNDPLHFAREHTPLALERFKHIEKDGGSRDNLPAHLVLEGHKTHTGYTDVYGRKEHYDTPSDDEMQEVASSKPIL